MALNNREAGERQAAVDFYRGSIRKGRKSVDYQMVHGIHQGDGLIRFLPPVERRAIRTEVLKDIAREEQAEKKRVRSIFE